MFGGKAMGEGQVSSVALKGNRRLTLNETFGQIIDLDEEKVYALNVRERTYTVKTFAELRKEIEEQLKKVSGRQPSADEPKAPEKGDKKEPEVEVDFSIKDTGQKRTIAGLDTHETVATITVREKGKTLEQSGGLVLTVDSWLSEDAGVLKELTDFERRYVEKMSGASLQDMAQTAQAMTMYPKMKPAMERLAAENKKLTGVPLLAEMKFDIVPDASQRAAAANEDEGGKGAGGMLAKMMARRGGNDKDAGAQPGGRATVMSMSKETLKFSTSVSAADVALPEGYRPK